jgi:histone H3/H4
MATKRQRVNPSKGKTGNTEDLILSLKDPQIGRLLYRAGAERIDSSAYEITRKLAEDRTDELLNKILVFTTHNKRKKVTVDDLDGALQSEGKYLMAGAPVKSKKCAAYGKSKSKSEGGEDKKPHRFHPGTVAARKVTFYQKNSDCFVFAPKPFDQLVRYRAKEIIDMWNKGKSAKDQLFADGNIKYSREFMKLFQLVIEEYLFTIFEAAVLLSKSRKTKSIRREEIHLAHQIRTAH